MSTPEALVARKNSLREHEEETLSGLKRVSILNRLKIRAPELAKLPVFRWLLDLGLQRSQRHRAGVI